MKTQMVLTSTQSGPQNITVADGTGNIGHGAGRLSSTDSQLAGRQAHAVHHRHQHHRPRSNSNVINSSELGMPRRHL